MYMHWIYIDLTRFVCLFELNLELQKEDECSHLIGNYLDQPFPWMLRRFTSGNYDWKPAFVHFSFFCCVLEGQSSRECRFLTWIDIFSIDSLSICHPVVVLNDNKSIESWMNDEWMNESAPTKLQNFYSSRDQLSNVRDGRFNRTRVSISLFYEILSVYTTSLLLYLECYHSIQWLRFAWMSNSISTASLWVLIHQESPWVASKEVYHSFIDSLIHRHELMSSWLRCRIRLVVVVVKTSFFSNILLV